jgi:hypothetical protein
VLVQPLPLGATAPSTCRLYCPSVPLDPSRAPSGRRSGQQASHQAPHPDVHFTSIPLAAGPALGRPGSAGALPPVDTNESCVDPRAMRQNEDLQVARGCPGPDMCKPRPRSAFTSHLPCTQVCPTAWPSSVHMASCRCPEDEDLISRSAVKHEANCLPSTLAGALISHTS